MHSKADANNNSVVANQTRDISTYSCRLPEETTKSVSKSMYVLSASSKNLL